MKLFIFQINELPKPAYLKCKLRTLRIGTLKDIETATEDTLIIEALTKFVNRRVSALPIVDAEGRLKDIYAKFDVIVSYCYSYIKKTFNRYTKSTTYNETYISSGILVLVII